MPRTRKTLSYLLLPGIVPRVVGLFSSGFSYFAFLVAVIYRNSGLLPVGHPYLKFSNFGRFGVRHVIAEVSNDLVIDRQNIDRLLIHLTIITGLVVLIIQLCLVVLSLMSLPAFAGIWTNTFLNTPLGPTQDLANNVLDRIFGIEDFTGAGGFFESCYGSGGGCFAVNGSPIAVPPGFPSPFHQALHQFFGFYTLGIAFLSLVVIIYFITAIIGESITSGVPFGPRFNKAWFIPRLVVFFALIAPMNMGPGGLNVGINAAQFITLGVAKFGSNMATNLWDRRFLCTLFSETGGPYNCGIGTGTPLLNTVAGRSESLIAIPNAPELGTLTQFLFVARLCMMAEQIMHNRNDANYFNAFIVREQRLDPNWADANFGTPAVPIAASNGTAVRYFQTNAAGVPTGPGPTFVEALDFSRWGNIIIRFGHFNPPGGVAGSTNDPPDAYEGELGYVKPTCGELTINGTVPYLPTDRGDPVVTGFATTVGGDIMVDPHGYLHTGGAKNVQRYGLGQHYYELIEQYFYQDPFFDELASCMLKAIIPYDNDSVCVDSAFSQQGTPGFTSPPIRTNTRWSSKGLVSESIKYYNNVNKAVISGLWDQSPIQIFQVVNSGGASFPAGWTGVANPVYGALSDPPNADNFIEQMRLKYDYATPVEIRRLGWAGAALWYHEISNINGAFMSAVRNVPQPTRYPEIMEMISQQHRVTDSNASWKNRFNPLLQDGKLASLPRPGDQYIAAALYSGFMLWGRDAVQGNPHIRGTSNSVVDVINMIFGTSGLYNMLEGMQIPRDPGPWTGEVMQVSPLAALSALGKGMLDASLRNLFIGVVGQGLGEIMDDEALGPLGRLVGDVATRFALIGVSIGFILYYVLPLLPFIYFFFGFSGWVKSIFEAMVAMPLWALAHIKIDGEGLPGPWATNGYFLLFEIFLRPTLMIFGLIASTTVFTAMVHGLNDSFHFLVYTASGYDIEHNLYAGQTNLPLSNPAGTDTTMDFLRGPLDEFMHTVMYAIIVYMLALANFKLIDQIPNHILRWMGATVSTFQERAGDPAGELTGKVFRTGEITKAQLMEMLGNMKGIKMGMDTTNTGIGLDLGRGGTPK